MAKREYYHTTRWAFVGGPLSGQVQVTLPQVTPLGELGKLLAHNTTSGEKKRERGPKVPIKKLCPGVLWWDAEGLIRHDKQRVGGGNMGYGLRLWSAWIRGHQTVNGG